MTKTLKLSGKMKTIDIKTAPAHDIGEAMNEALRRLEEMQNKCTAHFIPQVMRLLNADVGMRDNFSLEFIETMTITNGIRFEMQIDLDGFDLYGLKVTLSALECLCNWEPTSREFEGFDMHGYSFSMGDGDDAGAVYMRNGKLCVWVRGWLTDND